MPLRALFFHQGEAWLATATRARLRWISAGVALCTFLLTQALHWLLYPERSLDLIGRGMAADALGAVLIGILVYELLRTLNTRRRETLRRLQLIADLNHHIRNGLQAIQLSAQATQDGGAIRQIDDAVERISGVLQELVPMTDRNLPQPRI